MHRKQDQLNSTPRETLEQLKRVFTSAGKDWNDHKEFYEKLLTEAWEKSDRLPIEESYKESPKVPISSVDIAKALVHTVQYLMQNMPLEPERKKVVTEKIYDSLRAIQTLLGGAQKPVSVSSEMESTNTEEKEQCPSQQSKPQKR